MKRRLPNFSLAMLTFMTAVASGTAASIFPQRSITRWSHPGGIARARPSSPNQPGHRMATVRFAARRRRSLMVFRFGASRGEGPQDVQVLAHDRVGQGNLTGEAIGTFVGVVVSALLIAQFEGSGGSHAALD